MICMKHNITFYVPKSSTLHLPKMNKGTLVESLQGAALRGEGLISKVD